MHKGIKEYEQQVYLLKSLKAVMRSCILRVNNHCRLLNKKSLFIVTLYMSRLSVKYF